VRLERGAALFTYCTFSGNTGSYNGGAFYVYESYVLLTNCTIAGNYSESGGGIYCTDGSSVILTNCIVWGNAGGSIQPHRSPAVVASFSCIEGPEPYPGEGNLNVDPLLCGFGAPEIRVKDQQELNEVFSSFSLYLSADSPCIGAGKDGLNMGSLPVACESAWSGFLQALTV